MVIPKVLHMGSSGRLRSKKKPLVPDCSGWGEEVWLEDKETVEPDLQILSEPGSDIYLECDKYSLGDL